MTHDQENERNEKWLRSILDGLEASNSSAEAMAQRLHEYAHGGAAAGREASAKLVEHLMDTYEMRDKPERRVCLAIAARAIRRGRLLTEAEKLRNLADAMEADDIDPEVGDLSPVVARLRAEADKAETNG